jgi:pSer/pThr/pTyr-binding forkhead associated (FHA) protein
METGEPFPEGVPRREFALAGQQVLIGRPRPSRGIVVQVDLSGPPLDEGVSHAHALLTRTESGWQLSDAGSTNGTWLPGADNPIATGQYVLLNDGDTFYVGAWTKITLSQDT